MADQDDVVVWMYDPSFPLALTATILYALIFIAIAYLTLVKHRAWYFSCVVFGAGLEVAGYAVRCYSVKNQTVVGPFVVTLVLVVLAPVFIAAGNYVLIGRLIRAVLPPNHHRILGISARLLTRVFVICDIVTFLVQSAGSSIASSTQWVGPMGQTGVYVLMGGLGLQVATFSVFLAVFGRFDYLATKKGLAVEDAPRDWRRLVIAVYVSSAAILIRCIYRLVEFSEGMDGYAFQHEWLFWVFECVPMLIAIAVFCLFHPSRYLVSSTTGLEMKRGNRQGDVEDSSGMAN